MALFGKLCRTCLGTPATLYSFQKCVLECDDTNVSSAKSIGDMLQTLAPSLGAELCPDLPEQICEICLNELMRTTSFLHKWDKSESALRNMLNTARGTAHQEKRESKFHISDMGNKEEVIIMRTEQEITDEEPEVIEEDPTVLDWTDAPSEIDEPAEEGEEEEQDVQSEAIEMDLHVDELDIEEQTEAKSETAVEIVQNNQMEEDQEEEEDDEEVEEEPAEPPPPINSVTLLRCPHCSTTFVRKKSLENHILKYHGTAVEDGKTPESEFVTFKGDKKAASINNNRLDKETEFRCNICLSKFAHRKSLNNHMKMKRCQATASNFRCTVCNRTFVRKNALVLHMESHEKIINPETVELVCTVCPEEKRVSYVDLESLTEHMKNHRNASKRHTCDECGKSFSMYSTLKDHIRTHSGEKPYLCGICGKGFSQSTNMKQHMMRHNKEKPFKCDTCDYSFVSKGELEAHKRKHSGEHPFICDDCGCGFTTSSSLVKHKRTHTGARPYSCDWCDQSFSVLGTLKNHQRIHTGERPYSCQYCNKSFVQKVDMVSHTRIHTGERPYKCNVCGASFTQSTALKTHQKTHAAINIDLENGQGGYTIVIGTPDTDQIVEEAEMEEVGQE